MKTKQSVIRVHGLLRADCAYIVEIALMKIRGVQEASANRLNSIATVYYHESQVPLFRRIGIQVAAVILPIMLMFTVAQPVTAAAAMSDHGINHVVQAGENLFRIALRYGVTSDSIVRANGLADARSIYAGQRLSIPTVESSDSKDIAAPPVRAENGAAHVVQAGENLFRIALRYGVSVTQLQAANQLSSFNIFVGQKLSIPSAKVNQVSTSAAASGAEKQLVVDLSEQKVYVYEGESLMRTMIASTGMAATPTVLGTYRIYLRYTKQTMYGPGYYLPDVPSVQYFYQGYGFHGTYWHNNFGTPMSHGCVNLTIADAEWLYSWASIGTLVRVVP